MLKNFFAATAHDHLAAAGDLLDGDDQENLEIHLRWAARYTSWCGNAARVAATVPFDMAPLRQAIEQRVEYYRTLQKGAAWPWTRYWGRRMADKHAALLCWDLTIVIPPPKAVVQVVEA